MKSTSRLLGLEVVVHGRPVLEYPHEGETFIEGRLRSEYTLRLRNNSSRRAVVVVSVDGLSVMNGQKASRTDSGYVLDPYGSVEVSGWRLSDQKVAHFFFGSLPEGYTSQMGKPENIGVIGAVMYFERERVRHSLIDSNLFRSKSVFGGTFESLECGVSTGFGRETEHQVHRVHFDRESVSAAEVVLRYDTAENLRARGILVAAPHYKPDTVVEADPFPADQGCPPPPGWRRR